MPSKHLWFHLNAWQPSTTSILVTTKFLSLVTLASDPLVPSCLLVHPGNLPVLLLLKANLLKEPNITTQPMSLSFCPSYTLYKNGVLTFLAAKLSSIPTTKHYWILTCNENYQCGKHIEWNTCHNTTHWTTSPVNSTLLQMPFLTILTDPPHSSTQLLCLAHPFQLMQFLKLTLILPFLITSKKTITITLGASTLSTISRLVNQTPSLTSLSKMAFSS